MLVMLSVEAVRFKSLTKLKPFYGINGKMMYPPVGFISAITGGVFDRSLQTISAVSDVNGGKT